MSDSEETPQPVSPRDVEKQEEAKLRAKYPQVGGMGAPRPLSGHSSFLQKRLAKGQKYFDSGDYQMAKQKMNKQALKIPLPLNPYATGDAIPTPESVPLRKTSIIQPSKCTSGSTSTTPSSVHPPNSAFAPFQ